jgi:hypothetical protein
LVETIPLGLQPNMSGEDIGQKLMRSCKPHYQAPPALYDLSRNHLCPGIDGAESHNWLIWNK